MSCAARVLAARRVSSLTRSALISPAAVAPDAAAPPTWAARSVTLPATYTPGASVRPAVIIVDLQGRYLTVHHADATGSQLLRLLVGGQMPWCA
ncbi:MAG: hypothetical protein ACRDQA_28675 [Nocardioidaceae bacterium]